jgi:hypothetical protein
MPQMRTSSALPSAICHHGFFKTLVRGGCRDPTTPLSSSGNRVLRGVLPLAEEPLPGSVLFHNLFDTDLSVVTTTKLFYKTLRVFGCDASFFHSVALLDSDSVTVRRTAISRTVEPIFRLFIPG